MTCPCCGLARPSSQAVGLTERQYEVLEYLEDCSIGPMPTYQAIADAVGLKSKGRVSAILDQLEQRGHIKRLRGAERMRASAIVVIGLQPEARA